MAQTAFDCVVRGGRVGTAIDEFDADIGIKDGVITAIGRNLTAGTTEIDAKDRLVLPGGVDAAGQHQPAAGIDLGRAGGKVAADGGNHAVLDADIGVELVDSRGDPASADHAIECGLWHLAVLPRWRLPPLRWTTARGGHKNGGKSRRMPAWPRAPAAEFWS